MKNILAENMLRFGTKNLITISEQYDDMGFWDNPTDENPAPAATPDGAADTPTPETAVATNDPKQDDAMLKKVANLQDIKDGMKINFFDDRGQKKYWDSGTIVNAEQLKNPVNQTIVFEFNGKTMGQKVIAWSPVNAPGQFSILSIPKLTSNIYQKLKVAGVFKRLFSDSIYNKDLAALMSEYMKTANFDANADFGGTQPQAAAKPEAGKEPDPSTEVTGLDPKNNPNTLMGATNTTTTPTSTTATTQTTADGSWLKYANDNLYVYQLRGKDWFAKNKSTNVEYNISKNPKYKSAIDRLNTSLTKNELQPAK